jgi:hypothetical protein
MISKWTKQSLGARKAPGVKLGNIKSLDNAHKSSASVRKRTSTIQAPRTFVVLSGKWVSLALRRSRSVQSRERI